MKGQQSVVEEASARSHQTEVTRARVCARVHVKEQKNGAGQCAKQKKASPLGGAAPGLCRLSVSVSVSIRPHTPARGASCSGAGPTPDGRLQDVSGIIEPSSSAAGIELAVGVSGVVLPTCWSCSLASLRLACLTQPRRTQISN